MCNILSVLGLSFFVCLHCMDAMSSVLVDSRLHEATQTTITDRVSQNLQRAQLPSGCTCCCMSLPAPAK